MKLVMVVLMCCVGCGQGKPYVSVWNNDNLTCSKYDNGGIDGTQAVYPSQFCTVGKGFLIGVTQKYR